MLSSQLLYILVLAMVAGVILFRLYTVLGRRTDGDRRPRDFLKKFGTPNSLPKEEINAEQPDRALEHQQVSEQSPAVQKALMDIKLADKSFETEQFVSGAKRAYEEIVGAFAKGDKEALRPLLSEEVYAAFSAVLSSRAERNEKVDFTFVSFKEVKILEASLASPMASVTLSFGAQFISAIFDVNGALIEGDPKAVRSVTDIWTFERDVRSSDPNWRLVATSGEADLQDG